MELSTAGLVLAILVSAFVELFITADLRTIGLDYSFISL